MPVVAKHHGVSEQTIYTWEKRFGSFQPDNVRRPKQLEQENARLKKLVAERDLEIEVMKEIAAKNGERAGPSGAGGLRDAPRTVAAPVVRVPYSGALPARPPPAGWPGRPRRTGGRCGQPHSEPLRDRVRAPHAPDLAGVPLPPRQQSPPRSHRPADCQEGFLDGIVDAQPTKGNAARFAIVQPAAAAAIAGIPCRAPV